MVEVESTAEGISVIIPAYNEEDRLDATLTSLTSSGEWMKEIIVVDDGSTDQTSEIAQKWTSHLIKLPQNSGKAAALEKGVEAAQGDILLFMDADLEQSAAKIKELVIPILRKEADMTVAIFPASVSGGFGLVKKFAAWAIYQKTGKKLKSPLCGQRAIRKAIFHSCYQGDRGYGVEVGITLDVLEQNYHISEIEIPLTHRNMGRGLAGFYHRMKQGFYVCHALLSRR